MTGKQKVFDIETIKTEVVTTTRVYRVSAYTEGEARDKWLDEDGCVLESEEIDTEVSLEEDINDIYEYSDM